MADLDLDGMDRLLEQMQAAADSRSFVVELTLDRLTEEDAAFARVARLAAIPRRLDRGVVTALSGDTAIRESDDDLLDHLLGLSFVDSAEGGRVAYHDSVREALLPTLREEPTWRPHFEAASERLIRLFGARLDEAERRLRDLRRVTPLLARAAPERLGALADATETALFDPAVEALYHAVLAHEDHGWSIFEYLFAWNEERGLAINCRALHAAMTENLRRHVPEALHERGPWLTYYAGRLQTQRKLVTQAEESLRTALNEAATDDVQLRLKALGSLGNLLSDDYRLGAASEVVQERLALAQSAGDPGSELAAMISLAALEQRFGRSRTTLRDLHEDRGAPAGARQSRALGDRAERYRCRAARSRRSRKGGPPLGARAQHRPDEPECHARGECSSDHCVDRRAQAGSSKAHDHSDRGNQRPSAGRDN